MEEKSFDGIGILKIFGKNLIMELIISLIGMFILALVLSKTSVSDSIMGNTIIGISAFSIALGGLVVSRKMEMKGILCGALQGVLYMVVLYLISSMASGKFALGIEGIVMILVRYCCWWCWRNNWCKFKIEKSEKLL